MIKAISGKVTRPEPFPNINKCIIHFLDIESMIITQQYLKLAWSAGSVGAYHFYWIKIEAMKNLLSLNYSEIFDFQRLFIYTSSGVSTLGYGSLLL